MTRVKIIELRDAGKQIADSGETWDAEYYLAAFDTHVADVGEEEALRWSADASEADNDDFNFEQAVCQALSEELGGYVFFPNGNMGADYKDEFGYEFQLLPSDNFASYCRERLEESSNLPEDEDEQERLIKDARSESRSILINSSPTHVERFFIINLTRGEIV